MLERENLGIMSHIESDCAPLAEMVMTLLNSVGDVHVLRDPTRGGLAATLNEIAMQSYVGIKLFENDIPIKNEVRGVCEMLGLDPLYLANEGKMIVIVSANSAEFAVSALRKDKYGADACIIGEVTEKHAKKVYIKTLTGGSRIIDMPVGEQLPRIC